MSLVLATQAKCSSFYPFGSVDENREYDKQVRENVDALGKAVRWRMNAMKRKEDELGSPSASSWGGGGGGVMTDEFGLPKDGNTAAPKRHSLHRGPSLSQSGRSRRRGWRASTNMSQVYGDDPTPTTGTMGPPSRQNSDFGSLYPLQDWHGSVLEEDEDDNTTPGQSYAAQLQRAGGGTGGGPTDGSFATTAMMSETPTTYTSTAPSTMRGYSVVDEWANSQKTPQAGGMFPRRRQTSGNGSRESTPGPPEVRRRGTGGL